MVVSAVRLVAVEGSKVGREAVVGWWLVVGCAAVVGWEAAPLPIMNCPIPPGWVGMGCCLLQGRGSVAEHSLLQNGTEEPPCVACEQGGDGGEWRCNVCGAERTTPCRWQQNGGRWGAMPNGDTQRGAVGACLVCLVGSVYPLRF